VQSIAWSFLMLLVVLAAIPAALWTLKRLQSFRPRGLAAGPLEIVAQISVGQRERVMLVRVQDRVLVLGATAQQINLLGEADAAAALAAAPGPAGGPGFSNLLANLQKNAQAMKDRRK
jgi:flagellar protein FliO/FliZ